MNEKRECNDLKNNNNETRTPLSVLMNMSKNEIGGFVINVMQANNIPPFLMCYIIKSVLCDVQQIALEKLSDSLIRMQETERNEEK